MVERVYRQVQKSTKTSAIIVATDDERIFEHVKAFGGEVMMTAESHPSGTDRCFEVWEKQTASYDALVNVQGDEPFLAPEAIDDLIGFLEMGGYDISTLAKERQDLEDFNNPNIVKAVVSEAGKALYFSRASVPFNRDKNEGKFLQHVGIYAFKGTVISKLKSLKSSTLEETEKLEQLRWLENNFNIGVALTQYIARGVDTPEDINKFWKACYKQALISKYHKNHQAYLP